MIYNQASVLCFEEGFPIIIRCYMRSVEVNKILSVPFIHFTGSIYTFYLHSFTQHFGNHTGKIILYSNLSQKYGVPLRTKSSKRVHPTLNANK